MIGFVNNANCAEDNELTKDIIQDSRLYISPTLTNEGLYWTTFRYIRPMVLSDVDGDAFTLEARIKNQSNEGEISCYDPYMGIIGENGKVTSAGIMSPGFTHYANVGAADTHLSGTGGDNLTQLGRDFSDWKTIKIQTIDSTLKVYYEDDQIYSLDYSGSVGKIHGLQLSFKGSGSIDWVRLFDEDDSLKYLQLND